MLFKRAAANSNRKFSIQVQQLKTVLETADAVVIGAGAGLSTSTGFVYSGERFRKYFRDFEKEYGFHDMYTGGFYPFPMPFPCRRNIGPIGVAISG